MRLLVCALALVCACWGLEPSKVAALEELVTREMAGQRIPGMSIAVASGGSIWTNGYGLADLENFVPVKASTSFRTASTVKPMTAVAAWHLVEGGKLDLDASVEQYLPSFPKKAWSITTRQLLGHLSGVRTYRDGLETYLTQHYWDLETALGVFAGDDLVAEPGSAYLYSTFGYVLAGRVLEAAAGVPYSELMREAVFRPAGMTATQPDDVYRLISGRARGYQKTADGEIRNAALSDTSHKLPGGGYVTTSADLVRFAMALDGGKLLRPESVTGMTTSMRTSTGKLTGYGTGWGVNDLAGVRYFSHTGGQAGVSCVVAWLPAQHAAVAMMFNLEGLKPMPMLEKAIEIVLK